MFGQRDKVEEQMRDIARQGSAGARVSHWFAGLLIILFSLASLVSLGGDAFRAVVASLQHGVLDIPNAIALGVTALLVPAMDVAVLQAASVYRLLRMRRAELGDMWLHALVIGGISLIEAGTYCYMAGVYERPVGGVAWALIIARALAAPLIAVYLAMARPLPVTSRDILAQVELGAGQGVIRDVSEIANDPSAPLARKMELFGASAVMGEHEEDKLNRLIAVAQKGMPPALPAGHGGVPSVKIHAAATLPLTETLEHHVAAASAYKAMHDPETPTDPWAIYDETDGYEDEDPGITAVYSEDELAETAGAASSGTRHSTRRAANSGPARPSKTRAEMISEGMKKSYKERKKEGADRRARIIELTTYKLLDEWWASGQKRKVGQHELAVEVFKRANQDMPGSLKLMPHDNTVNRHRSTWQKKRTREARDDVPPMEPQELRELQEVW